MRLFNKRKRIAEYDTKFGRLEVVQDVDAYGNEVILMAMDGSFQSGTYTSRRWSYPPFRYIRSFDHMFQAETTDGFKINDVLMLGGGGFSYPKHVLTSREGITMDVVEADAKVVDVAREHFMLDKLEHELAESGIAKDAESNLKHNRMNVIIDDAYDYVASTDRSYDAIINDLYEGECQNDQLLDAAGVELVKSKLRQGGLYLINVSVDLTSQGARALFDLTQALDRSFDNIYVIDACDSNFGGADNYIVIASDGSYDFTDTVPFEL